MIRLREHLSDRSVNRLVDVLVNAPTHKGVLDRLSVLLDTLMLDESIKDRITTIGVIKLLMNRLPFDSNNVVQASGLLLPRKTYIKASIVVKLLQDMQPHSGMSEFLDDWQHDLLNQLLDNPPSRDDDLPVGSA